MNSTAKKPRAAKLPGVIVARESLDWLLREFSSGALPVSEEFQRKIWFTRLLDAGWGITVHVARTAVIFRRPGKDRHVVSEAGCDCMAWQTRGACPHSKVFVALGRTPGIARLVTWFENREPLK